ncbi:GIY-YIG nuclease family protein [Methylobacterium durans]|uniref:GIY-YIG nuclease family protein n=1 Tax=Methylobacterium durans TaxID=2202825 RepID=UPI002AFE758B|nr:GIY-YIG nuclease family protein [Methylobacterium durans]MEA1830937.1 GIY-YIG nuclease family protein [Methylobacterium durans]
MPRPTLEEIFAEPDEFGLLDVKPAPPEVPPRPNHKLSVMRDVNAFFERHGRVPDSDAVDHAEMRTGAIWQALKADPTPEMVAEDKYGLLTAERTVPAKLVDWRAEPDPSAVPTSLDEIFADEDLAVDEGVFTLTHSTPSSQRIVPDHRADIVPCKDFELFRSRFEEMQAGLEDGSRLARIVPKGEVLEMMEGNFFIRNGLLALIAERSEMSARGGSRDYRLRVIFSNGTESDPLMSSFRKSLLEDKTARLIERGGLGRLDPEWEADNLELSGTIYVARSLSDDPTISSQKAILHKIGVTSQDVRRRVADARNDPTFLLAPVELIATYELQNVSRHRVEDLLHRFFAAARPKKLFIVDRFGKSVHPKEWFYVLPEHVSRAVQLIKEGALHLYRYDPLTQKISRKEISDQEQ